MIHIGGVMSVFGNHLFQVISLGIFLLLSVLLWRDNDIQDMNIVVRILFFVFASLIVSFMLYIVIKIVCYISLIFAIKTIIFIIACCVLGFVLSKIC